jgi:tetratricopeptide (TPR) repeat protein
MQRLDFSINALCVAGLVILGFARPLLAHPDADIVLKHISSKIAANPKQQSLYLERAKLLILGSHYEHANADLRQADLLGPVINSSYYKGLILKQQHQYAAALPYFNHALSQYPSDSRVLTARAETHSALKHFSAAIFDYQQLLHNTVAPQPSHYLDVAKLVLKISNYHGALKIIDQGLIRLGLNPQLQQYAVDLSRSQGDIEQALIRHQSLQNIMKSNPSWYIRKAELLIVSQKRKDAESMLKQAEYLLAQRKNTQSTTELIRHVRLQQSILENYR